MVNHISLTGKDGFPFLENQKALDDIHQQERIAEQLGISTETFRDRLAKKIPLDQGNVLNDAAKKEGWSIPETIKAA